MAASLPHLGQNRRTTMLKLSKELDVLVSVFSCDCAIQIRLHAEVRAVRIMINKVEWDFHPCADVHSHLFLGGEYRIRGPSVHPFNLNCFNICCYD